MTTLFSQRDLLPTGRAAPLVDRYGRHITYLRVSVTDRCDFRCVYCMGEDMTFLPKRDVLSFEEIEQIVAAFVRRGVKRVRLTGGEPLVRRDILALTERLGGHLGHGLDEAQGEAREDLHVIGHVRVGDCRAGRERQKRDAWV